MLRNSERPSAQQCTAALTAVGDALYVIGGKWKLRIIIALSDGNRRFNELQRIITGISARVLSNELKQLELNGFVKRIVHANAVPVIVEYELNDYANTLGDVLKALHEWGAQHRARIKQQAGMKKAEQVTDQPVTQLAG